MNIYYIKCLMFTKNNKIKVIHEIVEKLVFFLVVLTAVLKCLQLLIKENYVIY